MDGSVNFYRAWDQYKKGFGSAAGEYWLGLESLYHLTRRSVELRVDMEDFSGNKAFARYSSFSIDPESDGYKLHVSGFTDGGAGDSMRVHNRQKFSTFDKDQAYNSRLNCAKSFLGAFWYDDCFLANPNGVYRRGEYDTHSGVAVTWNRWKGQDYSLKTISMKIRSGK
ncbi:microfibril-associated glycoprotein 4-like [Scomber scombrus]|uniref:Microfibril-associated glycoprotein 4-like n=1 Tax=Scomber scombrus TaxID=13677 RepID=A0AAV1Q0C1_SCOSC